MEQTYVAIILCALAGRYLLDLAADILNLRAVRPELPAEFAGHYDAARYRKSQAYLRATTRSGIVEDTVRTAVTIAFFLLGGFGLADALARSVARPEVPAGLMFAGMLALAGQLLALPFSAYETFGIEARYGFNRTSVRTFVSDLLKMLALSAVIGGAVFAMLIWLFTSAGRFAWLWCWAAVTAVEVVLLFLAPVVIMPMFNRFDPMPPGPLRDAIEAYARSQSFRMKGVFLMDGSKRSTKSNAFFTGIGRSRRIVLLDTLVAGQSVGELVAVVAHEMGHYRRRHILWGLAQGVAAAGLTFFVMSRFIGNRDLFAAFGMEHVSVYASLVLFGFLYAPVSTALGAASNAVSRAFELQADAFAARTCGAPDDLVSALKKLSADNLTNLTPHRLKVLLHYGHPPILRRIAAISAATSGCRGPSRRRARRR